MKNGLFSITLGTILVLLLSGCGAKFESHFDDTLDQASVALETQNPIADGSGGSSSQTKTVTLKEATNIRTLKTNILEFVIELPAGSVLRVSDQTLSQNYDYRKSDGTVERSSTGYLSPFQIVSVPDSFSVSFPASKLAALNALSSGLFVSATISGDLFRSAETFPAIQPGVPGSGFLKYYTAQGKPTFSYANGIRKRFGTRVNQGVPLRSMAVSEQTKWTKIYQELKKAGDRTVASPRDLMIIDSALAKSLSIRYENDGLVSDVGAWSVAVEGTATRHGFANVPCAETMSEVIRQAYQRAGYGHTEDFNSKKGNPLIWSSTAAVVELSAALNKAGWVPWDATQYRPLTGAILMHTTGISPGHTYMAAGNDGMFIVDNGSPRGRDLRLASQSVIDMMYMTGVFFLPPGIDPQPW